MIKVIVACFTIETKYSQTETEAFFFFTSLYYDHFFRVYDLKFSMVAFMEVVQSKKNVVLQSQRAPGAAGV